MRKRNAAAVLTALALGLGLLAGCGAKTPLLTADDYILDSETDETSRGVAPGATPDAFLAAYGDYSLFTSVEGGDYQALADDEIPFDSVITIVLPTFFVDGEPIAPDEFCRENEVETADLIAYLTSADYLNAHTAEYRYLTFTWENGLIADIQSAYMNYNEDGAN